MKYLMMIRGDESLQLTPAEENEIATGTDSWVKEMDGRGIRQQGDRLRPVSETATVRVRDGEVLIADGPFAETKEQIGGFDILECADLAGALEVAARHPMAKFGAIEVRQFWVY
jgi:hypothetical protein